MSVENELAAAINTDDPVARLQALVRAAQQVDDLRSEVGKLKGLAAADCAAHGYTQRQIADAAAVSPAMVQQWVKRGRSEARMTVR